MNSDSVNSVSGAVGIIPVLYSSSATVTGDAVDLQGYEGATILVMSGTVSDGAYTYSLTECDTSGCSYTAVAAADLIGTATVLALTDDDEVNAFGYRGSKRFIKVVQVASGVSSGAQLGVIVLRTSPRHAPV